MSIDGIFLFFSFFSQVRIPHDDNDMYDRHVLPAGHPHWTWVEHVIQIQIQRDCVCLCVRACVHVTTPPSI